MPSFTKLFSVAALAFAAFTSALPTANAGTAVDSYTDTNVETRSACGSCAGPGVPSLPAIITDLHVSVKVDIDALTAITKDTCTVEHVRPIVVSLCTKIDAAVIQIGVLGKYKIEEILRYDNVVCTVKNLAALICSLVIAILTAVGCVLRLIGNVKGDIYGLLCLVGFAVCRLLQGICGVVTVVLAELLVILCVDLKAIFWVCVRLNLTDLLVLLKIKVSLYL